MIETVSQLLVYIPGIAVFPIPIILAIVVLRTKGTVARYSAYLAGWVLGIGVIGGIAIAVINPYYTVTPDDSIIWIGWLRLMFGLGLVAFAVYKIRNLILLKNNKPPQWMSRVSKFSGYNGWEWGF